MDVLLKKTLLYDFYHALLTEKQKQIYSLYYEENLSLTEISEKLKITRQAVSDSLSKTKENMDYYEKKLGLMRRFKRFDLVLEELEDLAKEHVELKDQLMNIKKDILKLRG